jgi:hypothetical protein
MTNKKKMIAVLVSVVCVALCAFLFIIPVDDCEQEVRAVRERVGEFQPESFSKSQMLLADAMDCVLIHR